MPGLSQVKHMLNRFRVKRAYKNKNRDRNVWIFGEWFGTKCNDSCLFLANYVAENTKGIQLYWVAKDNCAGLGELDPRVRILKKDSAQALKIFSIAGVVFVNEGLQDLSEDGSNYFEGALIVNLWHGVPWKKIGMDTYRKSQFYTRLYAKTIFRLQDFSCFVSPSEACTRALESGFMIQSGTRIIKAGLPRNSLFYDTEQVRFKKKKILRLLKEKSRVINDDTKIITYMPTFRDHVETSFDFSKIQNHSSLHQILEKYNAVIVQKAHIVNQMREHAFGTENADRIITWNDCSAQELMAASDILITDYSSCFFDFLLLDRPIIHYLYDYEYYANDDRGLYYEKDKVCCGDQAMNEEELLGVLQQNLEKPEKDQNLRQMRRDKYLTYESADSCKKITAYVMNRINNRGERL